tara:strand:- start:142 stop:1470 length:1329 start_codon:yes stop_codon:yes gene_type:complete
MYKINKMTHTTHLKTRREITNLIRTEKLHPNPIGQRPAVPSMTKPIEIINAMLDGFFTGAILIRDIRPSDDVDPKFWKAARKKYPGRDFLVIDGGHRSRALRDFEENKIVSQYGKINQIDDKEANDFFKTEETVIIFRCTSKQATQIFRTINTVTYVNEMEKIMANEDSETSEYIRKNTASYAEYRNQPHELFSVKIKQGTNDLIIPSYFSQQNINPRREWDELVAVVLVKCLAGMKNVDAGYSVIENLVDEDEPLSQTVQKKVKTTLDDALKVLKFAKKTKYSKVSFGVFQLVYFEIMAKGGRIIDFDKFSRLLWTANATIDRKYDKEGSSIMSNKKAFAKGEVQSALAKEYIEEMGDLEGVVNFSPRTATYDQQYKKLAERGFVDADGNVLEMKNAEFLHLTPHSEGGTEGIVERKSLNHIIPTYEEALMLQKLREEKGV